jgi:hypothetical protein
VLRPLEFRSLVEQVFTRAVLSCVKILGRVGYLGRPGRMSTMSRTGTPAGGKVPGEQKVRVVLAVLSGQITLAEGGATARNIGDGQSVA